MRIGSVNLCNGRSRQFGGRSVEDDAALRHADDAFAIIARRIQRMQVGDDGDAFALIDVTQRVHHDLGVQRIERSNRLIGQHHLRRLHQRTCNGDTLLLAAGKRARRLHGHMFDAQSLQRGDRHQPLFMGEDVEKAERRRTVIEAAEHDIGQHVKARHQIELLEDHGAVALPVAERRAPQRRNFRVVEMNGTRGGIDEAVDHAQQRRFSRTRASDHADHLTLRYLDINGIDRSVVAETARDLLQVKAHFPVQSSFDGVRRNSGA
ncbi:hypothetical protein D3C71_1086910 [compost metagenome]